MKKIFLLGLFSVMSLGAWAQFSGSGSGTENDPYLIFNPIQLNQIRNFLNNTGVYFKMMADVDLTEWIADNNPTQGWQPIGTEASPFKGKVDGNGYTIKGLTINRPSTNYVGFFGYLQAANIHNVTFWGNVTGGKNTGGFSGFVKESSIIDVSFIGDVIGEDFVGGLCGLSGSTTITNVSLKGDVTSNIHCVGGLIGYDNASSTLDNCCYEGNVLAKKDSGDEIGEVGGLIGASRKTTIKNSIASGNVEGPKWVGGLIGRAYDHYTIIKSGAVTEIISTGNYVGGLVGECDTGDATGTPAGLSYTRTIQNCFSIGNINAKGDYVGGIVGRDCGHRYWGYIRSSSSGNIYYNGSSSLMITSSYHSGAINGSSHVGGIIGGGVCSKINKTYCIGDISGSSYVGGIAGGVGGKQDGAGNINYSEIKSSISISNKINASSSSVGRVVGSRGNYVTLGEIGTASGNMGLATVIISANGIIQECMDDEMNGTSVGKSTLKVRGTYQGLGWDFSNDWDIQETECFPYMMGQAAPPVIESDTYSGSTEVKGKSIDGGTVYLKTNGKLYSAPCVSNEWTIETDPLQAGQDVIVYAKTATKGQSYFTTAPITYPGKGTEDDPYLIYTAADLAGAMGNYCYKLMNNIDLTDYIAQHSPTTGWTPLGKKGPVAANFDGDGHIVSGLWISSSNNYVGLFSNASGTTIKNLNVVIAANKKVKGGYFTGGLIGKISNGKIENCSVQGDVEGVDNSGLGMYVGGLSGFDENSTFNNNRVVCNVTGTGTGTGRGNIGGVTGKSVGGNLSNLIYNGNITSSSTTCAHVGGIAGYNMSNLSLSSSQGTIAATGQTSHAGGIVGTNMDSASVANSYSTMNVTTTEYVGGVVGYNYGKVENCYASGNLSATNFGGGVIGYNDGTSSSMTHCVAANNNIVIADETGWASRVLGGVKNSAPTPDMNNYANKSMTVSINNIPQKIYDDNLNGTAKTTDQLMQQSLYSGLGWDFNEVWGIEDGTGYPYLLMEIEKPAFIAGDVTGDGKVTVADAAGAVSIILGESISGLNHEAADVTGDKIVSVADVAGIVNIILDGDNAVVKTSKRFASPFVQPLSMNMTEEGLSVMLSSEDEEFTAIQFDVTLPQGVSISVDEDNLANVECSYRTTKHIASAKQLQDGIWRVVCFSLQNKGMKGTEGEILYLPLTNVTDESEIEIQNIELVRTNLSVMHPTNIVATFSETTGIISLSEEKNAMVIYNLNGQRTQQLVKGINIVNGNKVIIK